MKDLDFIKELRTLGVELDPTTGEELQSLIGEVVSAPPAVLDKVKAMYPLN